jgi:hypothetical protein
MTAVEKIAQPKPLPTEMTVGAKIALEFFTLAKNEVLIRIRVRDTLLATYAAAAFTAIAAILSSSQLGAAYLYGVPYLSLAFTLLVSYHHAGIGALGTHCATDLLPKLAAEGKVFAFEYSNVFHQYHRKNATRRAVAHAMILLLPPAIALIVNFRDALPVTYVENPKLTGMWFLSMCLMLISGLVIHRSNRAHFDGLQHTGPFATTRFLEELEEKRSAA